MTAPKNRKDKKRPKTRSSSRKPNSIKSELLNQKYKNNMCLKEIRIVLQDIRFSPLIPKHQRHLLFKEEPKDISIDTHEKVSNDGIGFPVKETTESEDSSYIKSTEKSNENFDHDFIGFEKERADIVVDKEKETVVANKSFATCTKARRYGTRKRKVSSSTDQTSVTTDNTSHSLNFLEADKKLKKPGRSKFGRVKPLIDSSDSEIDKKRVKLTSGELKEHDDLKNVESSSHSLTNDGKVEIDKSNSLMFRDVKIKNVPVITIKPRRRLKRRTSLSTSEELVQIVQADTTVCTSNEEKVTIQSESPLASCNNESINKTIDTVLDNQEENAERVSALKELPLQKDCSKIKIPPRITEELVLLDGNINVISSENVKASSLNKRKTTSVEKCISDNRKQTDIKFKKKKLQDGNEALNFPCVKQPILQSNCDNIESKKNKSLVDRLQTNVNTSMLDSDKSTKQRSPSLLKSQSPKHSGENVCKNTNDELHGAQKMTVGSLTAENLQKHGKKVNCATIVRKFIEQTVEIPSSNSGVDDSKMSAKTGNAKKPSSTEIGPIKLNRERGIESYAGTNSDNNSMKQDIQMHEFKRPKDICSLHKGTDEQNKIKKAESKSFPKLKRFWKKPDCEVKKTEKSDVNDVARNEKIPIKNNVPEYITLHNEKPSTPPLETNREDRKTLNSRKENTEENKFSMPESDFDDCISLFADSLCFSDDDIDESAYYKNNASKKLGHSVWSNDVQCNIVGSSNFDAYVRKNFDDFDKEFVNVQQESDLRVLLLNKKKQSVEKVEYIPPIEQLPFTINTGTDVTKNMASGSTMHLFALFRGFCFSYLAGKLNHKCRYVHDLPVYVDYVYSRNQSDFWNILQLGIDRKWHYLVAELCLKSLQAMNGQDIFKVFKILYNAGCLTEHIVIAIVMELQNKKIPIYYMLRQLSFIGSNNTKLGIHIVRLVEEKIFPGEFWRTVKPLIPHIKSHVNFVERILHECIENHQNFLHIQEVHRDLMSTLNLNELSLIHPDLLMNFYRLLQRNDAVQNIQEDTNTNVTVVVNAKKNAEQEVEQNAEEKVEQNAETMVEQNTEGNVETESSTSESSTDTTSTESTSSSSHDDNTHRTGRKMETPLSIKRDDKEGIIRCTGVRSCENSVKNAQSEQPFKLQRIDDHPPPKSMSRGTFSKFYEDLNGLKVGLEDRNYDYVVDILSTAASTDNMSFYTDSCYQILQGEIMHSEEHLRKLIKCTVCRRMYPILYDILQDVVIRIIIDLADKEAWVLAYRLLKLAEKYILRFDAAFVLLSAEIYLANQRPLTALSLLRHHNLIYTNRSKWRVRSRAKNNYHRVEVMHILLEALSRESPMYASSLFQFLCVDQSNNSYHPIDLTRHADRIMSMLLLKGSDESIITMGRVILEFSIPLKPVTFRATIVTLVHRDEILARQLYQYAIRLGVYTTAQFSNVVTFTINMAWTEEEMYLAMSELIDRLSKDIGPAIEHLKASNIRIFLNMETIPTDRELYSDVDKGMFYTNLSKNGCIMLQRILARRFDPPLRVTKKGKYCRMITRSMMDYLKAHYCN